MENKLTLTNEGHHVLGGGIKTDSIYRCHNMAVIGDKIQNMYKKRTKKEGKIRTLVMSESELKQIIQNELKNPPAELKKSVKQMENIKNNHNLLSVEIYDYILKYLPWYCDITMKP